MHYIFCNGTGVLPFLDLFDFLLKKSMFMVLANHCGLAVANAMSPSRENYRDTFG